MKALILAAGQGTRLRRLTAHRPKPMLPLRSIPLLQHTITWLRSHGVEEMWINLHYHPEQIAGYFGNGARFGVAIRYSYENELLGTAGAAKKLQPYLDETFVVVYGDVYTNLNLTRIGQTHGQHVREAGGHLTLVLYPVNNPEACGLVETDAQGRITRFVEKPPSHLVFTDQAFSGVMLCEPHILERVPLDRPYDFGRDLIPKLLAEQAPLYAEPLADREFVIDIGTLGGYLHALNVARAKKVA